MNNEINYVIDNCITDLDTLIALDKRAMKDLENNTHEIEQHEVLTIIREFIRLRNDYNKEKEKNKELKEKYSKKLIELQKEREKNQKILSDNEEEIRRTIITNLKELLEGKNE